MAKQPERNRGIETPPPRFPETTPPAYPSSDYSFTLQAVMEMRKSVGKLTEAVESLKVDSRSHSEKLGQIASDIHAAKVVIGVVGSLIAGGLAFVGWVAKTYLDYVAGHH